MSEVELINYFCLQRHCQLVVISLAMVTLCLHGLSSTHVMMVAVVYNQSRWPMVAHMLASFVNVSHKYELSSDFGLAV